MSGYSNKESLCGDRGSSLGVGDSCNQIISFNLGLRRRANVGKIKFSNLIYILFINHFMLFLCSSWSV